MKGCQNEKKIIIIKTKKEKLAYSFESTKMAEFRKGEEGSRGLRALTLQLNADDDDDGASVTPCDGIMERVGVIW